LKRNTLLFFMAGLFCLIPQLPAGTINPVVEYASSIVGHDDRPFTLVS